MMVDIVNEFSIEAAPQRVWNALTSSEEIAQWWTDDLSATPLAHEWRNTNWCS